TKVRNSPSTSPPRTFTAPISVIASVVGSVPVVSRSTTTKVASANGVPRSSKLSWRRAGMGEAYDAAPTVGASDAGHARPTLRAASARGPRAPSVSAGRLLAGVDPVDDLGHVLDHHVALELERR